MSGHYGDPFAIHMDDVTPEPSPSSTTGEPSPPPRPPCACGCGEVPASATAEYMRGHHPRKANAGGKATKPPTRRAQAREAGAEPGKEINRVARLIGVIQGPAVLMLIAGQQTSSKALVADGIVVSNAAPGLSKALVDLAEDNAAIDKAINAVIAAGPYAELFAIVSTVGLQLASNHGALPDLPAGFGVVSVDEVLASAGMGAPVAAP